MAEDEEARDVEAFTATRRRRRWAILALGTILLSGAVTFALFELTRGVCDNCPGGGWFHIVVEEGPFDPVGDYLVEVCIAEDCTSAGFGPDRSEREQTLARLVAEFQQDRAQISLRPRRGREYGTQHVWVTVIDEAGDRVVFWNGDVTFWEDSGCECVSGQVTIIGLPPR